MLISLSDDYIVAESCPGLLYLFFLSVTLVYVHCDGDVGAGDVGKRHGTRHGKTSGLGLANDY